VTRQLPQSALDRFEGKVEYSVNPHDRVLEREELLEAVKLCHALGMDLNHSNSMGITALHGAANRGSNSIIAYLVANGADLKQRDNEGRSALDWAEGVFLATHPEEPKPASIALLHELLQAQGKESL